MKIKYLNNKKDAIIINDKTHLPIFEVMSYMQYLKNTGRSVNTQRTYIRQLLKWYRWCEEKNVEPLEAFASSKQAMNVLERFMSNLVSSGLKKSTINICLTVIYNYYDFLYLTEKINKGPSQIFPTSYKRDSSGFLKGLVYKNTTISKRPMYQKLDPSNPTQYISWEQYRQISNACKSARDAVLIGLMFECGLRISEALGIHIDDIHLEDETINIVYRENNENDSYVKRMQERKVTLSNYLAEKVLELLLLIEDYNTDYLFITMYCNNAKKGRPLNYSAAADIIKRLSKKTGIPFHAHMLRHGYAQERINDGWDFSELGRSMGHSSSESTKIYAETSEEVIRRKAKEFLEERYKNDEYIKKDNNDD